MNENDVPDIFFLTADAVNEEYLKTEIQAGITDLEAGNVSAGVEVLEKSRKRIF